MQRPPPALDPVDLELIDALHRNARASLKELAARVGLSSPATSQRLRRLVDTGLVRGFTVDLDLALLGYGIQVVVRVRPLRGKLHIVEKLIRETPECVECEKVAGEDCFVMRVWVKSVAHLDALIATLSPHADTQSAVVKSTTVKRRLPPVA